MPNLKFKQLLILSNSAKSANQFHFQKLNLITAEDNSVGKSTLAKLLFWGLGCEPELDTTWKALDCSTIVSFEINDQVYDVKRYKNSVEIRVNGIRTMYQKITGDFSQTMADILGFKALLPNQATGELEVPPPAYYFLPFYIDQKRSWSRAWDNFNGLGQYRSWKKTIIKYHVGLLTPEYFDFEIEKSIKKSNKTILVSEIDKINTTIQVVENIIPAQITTAVSEVELDSMSLEIEKDLGELVRKQEVVFDTYSSLQNSKSHLEHQKVIASRLAEEFDKDYVFAVERIDGDSLDCPLCGTTHDNSIYNKASIVHDKIQAEIQLEFINKEIDNVDKKFNQAKIELESIRDKIDQLNEKYLIEGNEENTSFSDIIVSIGGNSIKNTVIEFRKEKLNEIVDLDRAIQLANKSQKKLYSKEYIDDILSSFNALLSKYVKALEAEAVNLSQVNSPLSYSKIVTEGGAAENSRAILAYYLAVFSLVEKFGNEVVSPLVIDTPNQQEQSDNNYASIVNLILDTLSEKNQVIICAMSNAHLEPLRKIANIIKLDNDKLLSTEKYTAIANIFNKWEH
jgi:CRISPR/Cas system-associated exonuclease Cas4 (RecB family)